MEMSDEHVKIQVLIKNKGQLLANATISFETVYFGLVTIKDFQIWRSQIFNSRLQDSINIKPPTGYSWTRVTVFFEDKEKWSELELEIYNAYLLALNKANEE